MEALLILVIVIIFIIVINSKNKKKKTDEFFRSKARDFKNVSLPKYYFEEIYLQCVNSNDPIEEKIENVKNVLQASVDNYDGFLSVLSQFDTAKNHSLFFKTKEQYDIYMNQDEIDDLISKEIICDLPLLAALKRQHLNFLSTAKLYYNNIHIHEKKTYMGLIISPDNDKDIYYHQQSLEMAKATYRDVAKMNWEKLCNSYPKYNNESNRKNFLAIAYTDEVAFEVWKNYYMDSMLNVAVGLGLDDFGDNCVNFYKKCEKYDIFYFIKNENAFNEYSSIHEITDFSSEEISRIVDLYKQNIITGVYSKSKDPKYQ